MPGVKQERIELGAAEDCAVASLLPLRNVCGSALREPAVSSRPSQTSRLLDDALHALALAEKRLFGAQRENIGLRKNNEHLMEALDGASRRAVAAVRVSQHDGLTELPNRLLLIKRLQLAISHAAERRGHVADNLLSAVGARIAGGVRAEDRASRFGIAVYPQDGESHELLLQHADAAMFRDKAARRATSALCKVAGAARATSQQLPTETCAAS